MDEKTIKRDPKTGRCISGICYCGTKVMLGAFTCECDNCGQLFNWGGQALKPQSQWEEDY